MMQGQRFTEMDWKLFRKKAAGWQEAYMDKLNKEYIELLNQNMNPADKFWELEKRIRKDKKGAGVQLDMRRSVLIDNLVSLINEGVIHFEDLDGFSDELKEIVRVFVERRVF